MVRISWERQPLLLFSDVHRIGPVSFQHFQTPTDGSFSKHNVQMGLPEGHSVLLHFSQNGIAYQAVLVSMSSAPSKGKRGEHAMWKHAQPVSTDFAWLPEDVAQAFCAPALCQDTTDRMALSTRYNWDLMKTIRLGCISRVYTTSPAVEKQQPASMRRQDLRVEMAV